MQATPHAPVWVALIVGVAWGLLALQAAGMIVAALSMKRLSSYGLAVTGSVLAMVPLSVLWPISMAIGLWALLTLRRPEVRAAFGRQALQSPQAARAAYAPAAALRAPAPTGPVRGKMRSLLHSLRYLVIGSTAAGRPSAFSGSSSEDAGPAAAPVVHGQPQREVEAERTVRTTGAPGRRRWVIALIAGAFLLALVVLCMSWYTPYRVEYDSAAFRHAKAELERIDSAIPPVPPAAVAPPGPGPVPGAAHPPGELPGLNPAKSEKVKHILNSAHQDYLRLEAKHTQRVTDADGRQVVRIQAFARELDELEDSMWTQLDQILDLGEQYQARSKWDLSTALFPFGRREVTVTIWRQGSWYNWQEDNQRPVHGPSPPTYLEHLYKK